MQQNERLETWLAAARQLRSDSAKSEVLFLRHLEAGEGDVEMWRGVGFATFARLLDAENLCRPSRYQEYKDAVARLGIEQVQTFGVDAAREVNRIPSGTESRVLGAGSAEVAAVKELASFVERNHTPPSHQQSRAIVRRHYEPLRIAKPAPRSSDAERVLQLDAEVARLTKKVARLEKENLALRAKLTGASAKVRRAS